MSYFDIDIPLTNQYFFSNATSNDVTFTTTQSRILIGTTSNVNVPAALVINSNNVYVNNTLTVPYITSSNITTSNLNFTGQLQQNGVAYVGSQWTGTVGNPISYGAAVSACNLAASNMSVGSNITVPYITTSNVTTSNLNFTGQLQQNGVAYVGSQWTGTVGGPISYYGGTVSASNINVSSNLSALTITTSNINITGQILQNGSASLINTVSGTVGSNYPYPPGPLTGTTTTLSGKAYGNGSYGVSSSVNNNSPFDNYNAFGNPSTSMWSAQPSYNTSTGAYTGTNNISIDGVAYYGEWITLQMPTAIYATSITLSGGTATTFAKIMVAGLNSLGIWTSLATITGNTTMPPLTYALTSNAPYQAFIICIGAMNGASAGNFGLANVTFNTTTTVLPNCVVSGNLIPASNASYFLGNNTSHWAALYATNGLIQTSDGNEKDYVPLSYGLSNLIAIDTIMYKWKSQATLPDSDPAKNYQYYGVCADQLDKLFPELIYNEQNPLQINYSELIPICINAIKQLNAIVIDLQQQVASLLI